MLRLCLCLALSACLLASCNLTMSAPSDVQASDATAKSAPHSATAEIATAAPAASATITAPPAPTAVVCAIDSARPSRQISADARIDYQTKSALISQEITYAHLESAPLAEIVLDVQANQWEGVFQLSEVSVDGAPAAFDLLANRLAVALKAPLLPGCEVTIGLAFGLQPPAIREGLRAYRGFLGYSPRQLNLAHFLPTVAARLEGDWRIHPPVGIGEQVVHEIADWRVRLTVENAADSLQLAAPGSVTASGAGAWEILHSKSRDFAISLSEDFRVTERQTAEGIPVLVYSFADAMIDAGGLWLDGAAHTAQESARALELFSRQFGAYPYEKLVLVQGDFPDGMEFTGLVFVGSAWFTTFDGSAYNYLTLISVHEIAHQWWYAQVGNDAALSPWLDEALATYSEYLYIEQYFPADKNWWWTFRVANFFPQGMVDSTVYEFTTARAYINAVYLRGVQMLHNLREDIGDSAFFALLNAYRAAGSGQIADPALFWQQLTEEQKLLTRDTRFGYLQKPEV